MWTMDSDAESDASPDTDTESVPGPGPVPGEDQGWSLSFTDNSALLARRQIAGRAGLQFGGDRDLYDVLGWKRHPTVQDYYSMYLRNPLGRVIVNAKPATSWRDIPEIEEVREDEEEATEDDEATPFETEVEALFDDIRAIHYLERADKVSGIGEFGVIVLGLSDTDDMAEPVEEGSLNGLDDLAYLATFSQDRVQDFSVVDDPTDERYGLPEFYDIEFETNEGTSNIIGASKGTSRTTRVHWTRVVHVAEELLEDEVYGRPRLEAVYNTLFDIEKVLGGAAEMTWRGAGLRMQLDVDPEMQVPNAEDVAEQAEEMVMGLRHIMRTRGTDMNVIEGQTVDPSGITGELFKLIAGETGIPQRILTGSERGELASTQDRATFYGRISERQQQFCEPQMLRPLLDRLTFAGVLPEPSGGEGEYEVIWPDLFELNELEQAELMGQMAQALKNAAPMGDPGQVGTVAEIRKLILDWEPEFGSEVGDSIEMEEIEDDMGPDQPGDADIFDELDEFLDGFDPGDVPPHEEPSPDAVATDGGNGGEE